MPVYAVVAPELVYNPVVGDQEKFAGVVNPKLTFGRCADTYAYVGGDKASKLETPVGVTLS